MAKVITFSTKFPHYHPKKGEPTWFVEKIWKSWYNTNYFHGISEIESRYTDAMGFPSKPEHNIHNHIPKHHTIRAGHRWKAGDWFSPRVWSGKPYNSKMVLIGPDIEIKKVWNIEILCHKGLSYMFLIDGKVCPLVTLIDIIKNDGLTKEEFFNWFHPNENKIVNFSGQIICWSDKIEY